MARRESRGRVMALLTLLLLVAPVATTLAWLDATRWNYVLSLPELGASRGGNAPGVDIRPENLQRLKQSILNVRVMRCDGEGWSSGTSFVLARGYVLTAAHVVKENQACGSDILLVDHRGLEYRAELSGYSDETQLDLAVLAVGGLDFEPLRLADSSAYENSDNTIQVVTIGYPPGASSADEAALSGAGLVSSFRDGRFFTSGMDLNPGNSGGPVFVMEEWSVLGLAIAKGNADAGAEGLGLVLPSNTLASFFEDRTGQSVPGV